MANDPNQNTFLKASLQIFNENSDFSLWKTRMKAHLGLAGLKGIIDDFDLTMTVPIPKSEERRLKMVTNKEIRLKQRLFLIK